LGLAIAEKIVKEHNGMIWAENDLGEGGAITIALPVLD
jgi:Signal transduction histidine kinase